MRKPLPIIIITALAVTLPTTAPADGWLKSWNRKKAVKTRKAITTRSTNSAKVYVPVKNPVGRAQLANSTSSVSGAAAQLNSGWNAKSTLDGAKVPTDAPDIMIRMMDIATTYAKAGVSRKSDPAQVKNFLKLFGFNDINTAYCAAGVGYAGSEAIAQTRGASYLSNPVPKLKPFKTQLNRNVSKNQFGYFPTSALCADIRRVAIANQQWLPLNATAPSDLKPGWLVLFKLRKNDRPVDHVGIVVGTEGPANQPRRLVTVEFNTSSAVKVMRYSKYEITASNGIRGFVRTY